MNRFFSHKKCEKREPPEGGSLFLFGGKRIAVG